MNGSLAPKSISMQLLCKKCVGVLAFLLESETKKSSKFFVKQNQRSRKFNVDLNNNGVIILYFHKFLKLTFATLAVFSLNFGSAGKGPFMASKAKNKCPWGVEGVVEWVTLPGDLGAKSSETSFPHSYLKRSTPIILLCLQHSLSKMRGP